ncbi:ferredoxin [Trichlorobacter ammonificans]|uniref:Ferredoxin n=1 Tax=Trichlorobacter ammonificans TaxID=2916410 RepID=A0ABM9D834_9BACT|nr:ferredoxin [Trichlorobacter ammonificans]CAH2031379.1 Ferredoxin-1 [Trichlorobacter ammonificans]
MAREIWIDEEECISCELCVNNLPAVFRLAINGKAECYDPAGASEERIESDAINVCPASCIHWK